jgi:hypothetical protein
MAIDVDKKKASVGKTMTRRDRCTYTITTLSRRGRDPDIHEALQTVLAWRGLSALTDAAIEDLARRLIEGERARRLTATQERSRVINLEQYRNRQNN